MEDKGGSCPAVEEEEQIDEERYAALALENAGLVNGQGPVPCQRRFIADAVNNLVDLARQDDQERNADGVVAAAADGSVDTATRYAVQEPYPLPTGVPVVEDVDESEMEEGEDPTEDKDDASSAGVNEDNKERVI